MSGNSLQAHASSDVDATDAESSRRPWMDTVLLLLVAGCSVLAFFSAGWFFNDLMAGRFNEVLFLVFVVALIASCLLMMVYDPDTEACDEEED